MLKALVLLLALWAWALPAPAAEPASGAQRRAQKVVRSDNTRRDWELQLESVGRKFSFRCVKAMTGRCAVRFVDAPKADSSEADLHVEWIGVPVGATVERTLKGQAYGLCIATMVGEDKACDPPTALTAL